ncbi:hypothetical protein VTJ04DRAFT_3001 [Mycothermus thermophilus]|uniref:uncharacterized protein n=1 Tax=Humicola insolens TaxID=85995 RepID=UPI00374292A2
MWVVDGGRGEEEEEGAAWVSPGLRVGLPGESNRDMGGVQEEDEDDVPLEKLFTTRGRRNGCLVVWKEVEEEEGGLGVGYCYRYCSFIGLVCIGLVTRKKRQENKIAFC